MQSEVVSQTVLRCKVPPGPGMEGTGRVPLRVEIPARPSAVGLRRSSSASSVTFDSGSRGGRGQGGALGVDVFEYRCPSNSPSNSSAPPISRSGTPRVSESERRRRFAAGCVCFEDLRYLRARQECRANVFD